MSSLKLVRCEIRPTGGEHRTPRFVPLEIYGLWEYLITAKHGFEVVEPRASLWLDVEDAPEAAYQAHQYERVTEVTAYVFSSRDEMFTRACRYFRSDECDRLKEIFLSHYRSAGARIQTQVRERSGIWLQREVATAEA
jgi:hypothetical protein